jgi:ribosomal protein S18 acetylase RimI-like enzyme
MPEAVSIRLLAAPDLADYKELRDRMLAQYPDAFTSDAATEVLKPAASYAARIGGADCAEGHFTLGAYSGDRLVGAITCERQRRSKVRHIGHMVGMMVDGAAQGRGVGKALLQRCIELARVADGLEMLTLTVTSTNLAAIALYRQLGFECFGTQRRAIKHAGRYHDKDHMVLSIDQS